MACKVRFRCSFNVGEVVDIFVYQDDESPVTGGRPTIEMEDSDVMALSGMNEEVDVDELIKAENA